MPIQAFEVAVNESNEPNKAISLVFAHCAVVLLKCTEKLAVKDTLKIRG